MTFSFPYIIDKPKSSNWNCSGRKVKNHVNAIKRSTAIEKKHYLIFSFIAFNLYLYKNLHKELKYNHKKDLPKIFLSDQLPS